MNIENPFCSSPFCTRYTRTTIGGKPYCGACAREFVNKCVAIVHEDADGEVDEETEALIAARLERDIRMV